ncbi:MAG: LysM peptidoglycan-binding domain-containing protein, partial [Gammaproteobacteria bacterium]
FFGPKPKPEFVGPKLMRAVQPQFFGPKPKPEFVGPKLMRAAQPQFIEPKQNLNTNPMLITASFQNPQPKISKAVVPTKISVAKKPTLAAVKEAKLVESPKPAIKQYAASKPLPKTTKATQYQQPKVVKTAQPSAKKSPYTQSSGRINYRVQSGETLMDIAHHFNISPQQILHWNSQISSNGKLYPGQRLTIYRG